MILPDLTRDNFLTYIDDFADRGFGRDVAVEVMCSLIMAREQHLQTRTNRDLAAQLRRAADKVAVLLDSYDAHVMRTAAKVLEP